MSSPSPDPERAIYGFVLYLFSSIFIIIYLVWSLVPDEYLHAVGLTYWPQKHWAISAPIFLTMAFFAIPVVLVGFSLFHTAPFDSIQTITDGACHLPRPADELPESAIPPIADIDLSSINRKLYLE